MFASVGWAILWRTCIYTRGGIFRFVGRILDRWVDDCTKWDKDNIAEWCDYVLRFIAYPLGRCIYCSSFHITYATFFIANERLDLGLNSWFLLFILPITHLLVIAIMKLFINGNPDMEKGDWE